MGEYRVAADKTTRRRVFVSKPMSLSPSLQRQQEEISLFDKYMPQNRHQLRRSQYNGNNNATTPLPSSTTLQCEELNRRYYFWKDETTTINPNIIESSTVLVEIPSIYIDNPSNAAVIQRHVSYIVMDAVVNERRNDDLFIPPTDENTVVVSCLNHSVLTGKKFKGTYYAFLMSHTVPCKKKDTNIGVSRYPVFSVIAHNNQARINTEAASNVFYFPVIYDKDTAQAAPHWRLNTTLGPFFSKRAAEECCHEWVKKTRGTTSKQDKARVLAEMFRCSLYSSQKPLNMSIERYLYENNAPLQYIKTCQAIKSECHSIIV